MPESPNVILQTINILNQRYGLDINLKMVEDSQLLPHIDKRSMIIRFNNRLLPLFILYQLGNADLVTKYFLTHKYLSYGIYDKAEYWLERTSVKIKKVVDKIFNSQNTSQGFFKKSFSEDNNMKITIEELHTFQLLFVILHEYSHGLFYSNKDIRNDYFVKIKKNCSDLESVVHEPGYGFFWGVRPFAMESIGNWFVQRNLELVKDVLSNDKKLEEFACDLHAWHIIASIMHYGGYSLDEQYTVFTLVVEALYDVENYKVLDDCLSYKIDMSKAENIALFDSMRYSLLTYTIAMYLEDQERGLGRSFDDQFSILRWTERKDFVSVINRFLPMTKDLENGSQIPNKEFSESLYTQIDELDNYILNII